MKLTISEALKILHHHNATLIEFLTEISHSGVPGAFEEDGTISLERLRTWLGY